MPKQNGAKCPSALYYRDKSGLECDAVMHLRGGRYGLIEVKLGGSTGQESAVQGLV